VEATPPPARRSALWVAALAVCVLAMGCGGGQVSRDAAANSARAVDGAEPFRIVATDEGFAAAASIPAGMRHVLYENRGSKIHEAMLVKLPAGMDAAGYVAAVKAGSLFPKGALDYSGPGLTSPGETTELWLRVDPGRYILICWNDDHARSTPVHPFTVRDDVVDDPPPREDVVVKLVDYHFEVAGALRSGTQVIKIETTGPSMHEADLYRLDEGRTLDDLNRWRKEPAGAAPARALGGILDSHDLTHVVWLRKTLAPGRYVLHCEMPMNESSSGGNTEQTHADLGMARLIEIAR